MTSLADRFAALITLEYSLIDRMSVRGDVINPRTSAESEAPWLDPGKSYWLVPGPRATSLVELLVTGMRE